MPLKTGEGAGKGTEGNLRAFLWFLDQAWTLIVGLAIFSVSVAIMAAIIAPIIAGVKYLVDHYAVAEVILAVVLLAGFFGYILFFAFVIGKSVRGRL